MKKYRIKPRTKVKLSDYDSNALDEFKGRKKEGKKALKLLCNKLCSLQKNSMLNINTEY